MTDNQLNLYSEPQSDKYFIPLNRENALFVLSNAAIYPEGAEGTLLPLADKKLLVLKTGLRETERQVVTGGREERFPVLVEVAFKTDKKVTKGQDPKQLLKAVPISCIKFVHFESEDEKEDFLARPVRGFSFDWFKFSVSPGLFSLQGKNRLGDSLELTDEAQRLLYADSLAGAFLASTINKKGNEFPFEPVASIAGVSKKKNALAKLVARSFSVLNSKAMSSKKLEENMVFEVIRMNFEERNIKGSDQELLFEEVAQKLETLLSNDEDKFIIHKWKETALSYLNNLKAIDQKAFSDNKSIPLRAALLAIWKETPEELDAFHESFPQIGQNVFALAKFMTGVRKGLMKTPAEQKSPNLGWVSQFASDIYNHPKSKTLKLFKMEQSASERFSCESSLADLQGNIVATHTRSAPSSIYRIHEWAVHHGLSAKWVPEEEALKIDGYNLIIRSENTPVDRVLTLRASLGITKPTKSQLQEYVLSCSRPGVFYRVMFDDSGSLCLAADLLERTLDEEEFEIALKQIINAL